MRLELEGKCAVNVFHTIWAGVILPLSPIAGPLHLYECVLQRCYAKIHFMFLA